MLHVVPSLHNPVFHGIADLQHRPSGCSLIAAHDVFNDKIAIRPFLRSQDRSADNRWELMLGKVLCSISDFEKAGTAIENYSSKVRSLAIPEGLELYRRRRAGLVRSVKGPSVQRTDRRCVGHCSRRLGEHRRHCHDRVRFKPKVPGYRAESSGKTYARMRHVVSVQR